MDVADALAYLWVLEDLFAVVWAPWTWELAEAIRSGEFLVELLRPGDLYLRQLAFGLGRTLSVLVTRTVPTLAVAALVPGRINHRPGRGRPRRRCATSGATSTAARGPP